MCTQLYRAFPRTENSEQKYSLLMLLVSCCIWYIPGSLNVEKVGNVMQNPKESILFCKLSFSV